MKRFAFFVLVIMVSSSITTPVLDMLNIENLFARMLLSGLIVGCIGGYFGARLHIFSDRPDG